MPPITHPGDRFSIYFSPPPLPPLSFPLIADFPVIFPTDGGKVCFSRVDHGTDESEWGTAVKKGVILEHGTKKK